MNYFVLRNGSLLSLVTLDGRLKISCFVSFRLASFILCSAVGKFTLNKEFSC